MADQWLMSSASSNIQNWRHTTLDTALIVLDLDCYQAWITSQGPAQDHPQQSLPSLDEVHPTKIRVKCKLSKSSQGLGFFLTFLQKLNLLKIPKTQTGLPRMYFLLFIKKVAQGKGLVTPHQLLCTLHAALTGCTKIGIWKFVEFFCV